PTTSLAPPRSATPPVAGRSHRTTVTPVRPIGSAACPTRSPGTSVIILTRSARPVRLVGGLRRGAARLRCTCRDSFHAGSARPVRLLGGLRRGAARLRPPRSLFTPRDEVCD